MKLYKHTNVYHYVGQSQQDKGAMAHPERQDDVHANQQTGMLL